MYALRKKYVDFQYYRQFNNVKHRFGYWDFQVDRAKEQLMLM